MTAFDVVRGSFSERLKRVCLERRLQFPMEMAIKGDGWEIGGMTDGKGDVRMFRIGTPAGSLPLPLTLQGIDANGKQFTIEVAG